MNIYSKSESELGRFLSNFSETIIDTEDGRFHSIEAYWYWLLGAGEEIRTLSGYAAKSFGRKNRKMAIKDKEFKRKIINAIEIKLKTNLNRVTELIDSYPEEITHFYKYGNVIVEPKDDRWVVEIFVIIRESFTMPIDERKVWYENKKEGLINEDENSRQNEDR